MNKKLADIQVMPKFCALCVDDEENIGYCGTGDTPDDAFNEFISGGEFENYCAEYLITLGESVEVYIYSIIAVEDSDWPEEERNPDWLWCLDKKLETRTMKAI